MSLIDEILKRHAIEACLACGERFVVCGCDSVEVTRALGEQVARMETALLAADGAIRRIDGTLEDYGKHRLPEYVRKEIGEARAAYRKAVR